MIADVVTTGHAGRRGHLRAEDPGVVVYQDTEEFDAIDEYSRRLAEALRDAGAAVRYAPDGVRALARVDARIRWVLLQYNPLSYGRWGIAPDLVGHAIALRRRTGARLVLSVHESNIRSVDWRTAVMGAYQRVQLRPLLSRADAIITMTEALASKIGRDAVPIPVGTTVTPVSADAVAARARFGLERRFVVSLFGRGHPSRALDYAERAIAELIRTPAGRRLTVLNLGDLASDLALPRDVDVRTLGGLDAVALSHALRASHMLLLPFSDGLSARRTTLMAGLSHGVPVVGLRGPGTDGVLVAPDALVLTPIGDRAAFARTVVALAADEARLGEIGEAGRRLYVERFGWPVVARAVLDVVMRPR